jgi:hypothetical protein
MVIREGLFCWGSNPCRGNRLFSKTPRASLGPTQPSIQWVTGFLPVRKRQGLENNHPTPSSIQAKNEWSYNSLPLLRGVGRDTSPFLRKYKTCLKEVAYYTEINEVLYT